MKLILLFVFLLSVTTAVANTSSREPGRYLVPGYEKAIEVSRKNIEQMSSEELSRFGKGFLTSSNSQRTRRLLELMVSKEARLGLRQLNSFIGSADDEAIRSLLSSFSDRYNSSYSLDSLLSGKTYKDSIVVAAILAGDSKPVNCKLILPLMYLAHIAKWKEVTLHEQGRASFLTWKMIDKKISDFAVKYPEIVSLGSIGKTLEGRLIPLLKISDNVSLDEDEPEILYVTGMHPREQQPYVCTLQFIEDILTGYGNDPAITKLVNEREIWFVPMLNVDGKIYDFRRGTSPRQRSMWRKNRFHNADRTWGVDLNRNFPVRWLRTTLVGNGQDFPGTGPASEPETKVLMDFVKSRPLRAFVDLHSYMGVHIVPRYLTSKDAHIYQGMLDGITAKQVEPYPFKTPQVEEEPPFETHHGGAGLGFVWAFYATGAYGINIEVGGRGFYPVLSSILKEYEDNIRGPLFHLLDICETLPLTKPGTAELIDGIASDSLTSGALLTWRPVVKGDCKYGVLVSMSANVRVLAEYRLAPFSQGFTLKVMPKAVSGDIVPMILYLWDDDHRLSVKEFELTIGDDKGAGLQQ